MAISLCIGGESHPGESRVTVTPQLAKSLRDQGFNVAVQAYDSSRRCYPDSAYLELGIPVVEATKHYQAVIGLKPFKSAAGTKQMHPGQLIIAAHHIHKGRRANLPTLAFALQNGISLFDYELFRIGGVQVLTTSYYAGMAGCYNALWAFGQTTFGASSRFKSLPSPRDFGTDIALRSIIEEILPLRDDLRLLVVGTGQCAKGAVEVCSWLKIKRISPAEVLERPEGPWYSVLGTQDIVERTDGGQYDKHEYRIEGGCTYRGRFGRYLGKHNVLVFTPYWDDRFPKLLPRQLLAERQQDMPTVISDITCDIGGSLDCTLAESTLDQPVFTYFPNQDEVKLGIHPNGIVVTAVDNVTTEVAVSASEYASRLLAGFLPTLLRMDLTQPFEKTGLPPDFGSGFLTYRGKLMMAYRRLLELLGDRTILEQLSLRYEDNGTSRIVIVKRPKESFPMIYNSINSVPDRKQDGVLRGSCLMQGPKDDSIPFGEQSFTIHFPKQRGGRQNRDDQVESLNRIGQTFANPFLVAMAEGASLAQTGESLFRFNGRYYAVRTDMVETAEGVPIHALVSGGWGVLVDDYFCSYLLEGIVPAGGEAAGDLLKLAQDSGVAGIKKP